MRQPIALLLCVGFAPAVAAGPPAVVPPVLPYAADGKPVVWVVDGAGDLKGCSKALTAVVSADGSAVELAVFPWSHGHRRLLLDQIDHVHAREQGARLAATVLDRKRAEPGRRAVVVAHSAGCAVALAACEALPADAIDRVVLLAPSVSTGYDIRPALRAAREGFDVFCSRKDWIALGVAIKVVRTTDDPTSGAAAGRYGFRPGPKAALAPGEVVRLRQHFWTDEMARTGHTGGHYGTYAPGFIRAYLAPLLTGTRDEGREAKAKTADPPAWLPSATAMRR